MKFCVYRFQDGKRCDQPPLTGSLYCHVHTPLDQSTAYGKSRGGSDWGKSEVNYKVRADFEPKK
jgi:hypothetical protein